MRILIISSILLTTFAIADSPFKNLSGQYFISSAPEHDPVQPLPENTHAYFSIEGVAAKEIYDSMNTEPTENLCGENHLEKKSGDFGCAYYPKSEKYACHFSVNLNSGALDAAGSC
jgi:hypothetical protein